MAVWVASLAATGGCFVDASEDEILSAPCDDVACSDNGYCEDGACFCDPYFVGNPNALHGCQPSVPGSACETTCGLNAYCADDAACRCADGFVAVCGTGDCLPEGSVCDGVEDCINAADESREVCTAAEVQQWALTDGCDDGQDVAWRLWSRDRGWVWPNPDETFLTEGPGLLSRQSIDCVRGETICLGAEVGDASWGAGLDGTFSCDDCCVSCAEGLVDFGTLACG